jgi:hypothetical protein
MDSKAKTKLQSMIALAEWKDWMKPKVDAAMDELGHNYC